MKKLTIALAAALISVTLWLWPHHPTATTSRVPTSGPTSQPSPMAPTVPAGESPTHSSSDTGPYSSHDQTKKAWEPIIEGFAIAYPDTHRLTRQQWLANLRPFLSSPVLDALARTDLDKVPAGHYAGYEVLQQADESLTVRVTYQEGWALVLYVVAVSDRRWVVDAFDRSLDFD